MTPEDRTQVERVASVWTKPEYAAADAARQKALTEDPNDQMSALAAAVDAAIATLSAPAEPSAALSDEACPFCASTDTFVERADFSSCYVVCNDCGARGPTSCDETTDDADATDRGDCEPGELAARRLWGARP